MRRSLFLSVAALACTSAPALAQMAPPKMSGQPSSQEEKFVDDAGKYARAHWATTAEAKRAGFVEFTPEDKTGAISWANRNWTSTDAHHPSQVWFDANGRLIGLDFSVLQSESPQAPQLWGIDSRRWIKIGQHVHYGVRQPDGSIKFGGIGPPRFLAAGGSMSAPTKQVLVNMGLAKSADDVAFIFTFPAIWDLQFWIIPNPEGAFAEANPNVKPKNAQAHPT
jgi:hypothetical protein